MAIFFLHKLGSIKYEHFDQGIDVECLEKCLSQLNNCSCPDVHGFSKCHCLFSSFLTHCFTPSNVIFLRLIRDKRKSADVVSNYRLIIITSILILFKSCLSDFVSKFNIAL